MRQQTAQIANADLLKGERLYQERARKALPYLVQFAEAGRTIYYSDLADQVGMPNPRNLNYVLGSIGNALIELGSRTHRTIPPIQCLVVNKNTELPGEGIGWFIDKGHFNKLTRSQKRSVVDKTLLDIFAFPDWDWVLKEMELERVKINIKEDLKAAKSVHGGKGESEHHLKFKNFIARNPIVLGLGSEIAIGQTEYVLPSSDTVDVLFIDNDLRIGVEVKSKVSQPADILRGLFQCVKYKYLIEAEQVVNNQKPSSRVILALEGKLPTRFIPVKNILGIEVLEQIKIDPF